jgi:pyruvate/2-oxoglutarate dehydrogenase complex dihydrolipoamide dehydrogenase (E3) component
VVSTGSVTERYENLVIGGGMAGLPIALRAARHGRTAFVEKEKLGGTCLNRGCIPTKTMIASAAVAHHVRRAADFGVHTGQPRVDLSEVVDRKDKIVADIRAGSYRAVGSTQGMDFVEAEGHFVGPRRLRLGSDGPVIEADRIFLVTGTRTAIPDIEGIDRVPYFTSRSLLDLRELPEHLVVVGGGYIGCEFAQMFRRFGSRVTVVQRADRLLAGEDADVSAAVLEGFLADGIDVRLSTTCINVAGTAGAIAVGCSGAGGEQIHASHLLVATGRVPNSDRLGLEHLALEPSAGGFVSVDEQLRTSAEDVWALGDLRGGPMFTHTARDDADVVYRTVFRDTERSVADRIVPHAVFVDPEVAAVGLTQAEARAEGYDVIVGRQAFEGVAKARAIGSTIGLVKFVVDGATDRILGCHIAGPDAGNLVHEAVIAMVAGATYGDIGRAIHVHPTLAEGVNSAAGGVHRPAR